MSYEVTPEMNEALDIRAMPKGKDWMNIAPEVVRLLTPKQIREILIHIVSQGSSEVNSFYDGLKLSAGSEKAVKMINAAKYSKYGFKKKTA